LKQTVACLSVALSLSPLAFSQSTSLSGMMARMNSLKSAQAAKTTAKSDADTKAAAKKKKNQEVAMKPFSQLAVGGGVSILGVNMQAATNVNRRMNVRVSGNVFNYSVNDITIDGGGDVSGLTLDSKLNFASGGVSLDIFPFPTHGLRLSPGVMLYNMNKVSATGTTATGQSFTLNDQDYYSSASDPLLVSARLGFNSRKQTFTMTTGWGNMISRKGHHLSFPFEIGAAFTGTPDLNIGLKGTACTDSADAYTNGATCVNMATNETAQSNLQAQVAKYKSDLDPLKVYPIVSFGVSYSFHVRK
jgi:hypothetical protein